jgi:hypothetical protein
LPPNLQMRQRPFVMSSFSIGFCIAALLAAVSALPSPEEHFLGLAQLHHPAYTDGKVSNQSFTHIDADGRITRIDYHVEHAQPFEDLDTLQGLDRVTCHEPDMLALYFEDDAAAARAAERLVDGLLVVGSSEWECGTAHENTRHFHRAIHRRIVGRGSRRSRAGPHLTLQTCTAAYTDFFKNADIVFSTAKFPAGPRAAHEKAEEAPYATGI